MMALKIAVQIGEITGTTNVGLPRKRITEARLNPAQTISELLAHGVGVWRNRMRALMVTAMTKKMIE